MRRLTPLLFATLALAAAAPLAAQAAQAAHPDFSGTWNMDVSKLEGPMAQAGLTSATLVITQTGNVMKHAQSMSSAMGSDSITVNYNMDGTESKNTISQGTMSMDMTSKTSWDGPVFVINTTSEVNGSPYTRTDRYSLDATGKVLTIDSTLNLMGQTVTMKEVFNKAA